jgi:hypothetical protein
VLVYWIRWSKTFCIRTRGVSGCLCVWNSLEGNRAVDLLCHSEFGQHIQTVFTRKVYCSLVCKHHYVEFMNSYFLLAQPNRSCFLIGSHDGELIYASLAQVAFLVLVVLLALLLALEQCARRRTPHARHCCCIHESRSSSGYFMALHPHLTTYSSHSLLSYCAQIEVKYSVRKQ